MHLESDLLLERQKIRKKLILWRCFTIFILFITIVPILVALVSPKLFYTSQDHLVKLKIEGVIGSDVSEKTKLIKDALKDPSVKGMILYVNSPGGAATGGEQLHDALVRFSKLKPIVVTMGGVAASAGYMISAPANRIFAFNSTLTGSIGVIMQAPDVSNLLNKIGVNVNQLVSGPLKGQPSIVKPLSPEGKEMLQGLIMDFYNQFVTIVADGRHMDIEKVKQLADGRPYSGQQALRLGLVDQIGDVDDAKNWLVKTYHLSSKIKVIELKEKDSSKLLSHFIGETVSVSINSLLQQVIYKENTDLNGVVSIWKP